MTRIQLEHAIRAACSLLGTTEVLVVGSQSILGSYPEISGPLSHSTEVDVLPNIELMAGNSSPQQAADILNGSLGEGSAFESSHKFMIEGVVETDMSLPKDWRKRTKPICNPNTNGCTGHCLDPYDMATAKLAAGREKDKAAIVNLIRQGIIKPDKLRERVLMLTDSQLFDGYKVTDLIARLGRWKELAHPRPPTKTAKRGKPDDMPPI